MKNLAKALSLFQGELKPVAKDSENPYFKSGYSSLTACWEMARPLLAKHGLAVLQTTRISDSKLILVTRLLHESGEMVEGEYPIHSKDNSPQSIGSALTYAKRYALQAILGISSQDDDGHSATHVTTPQVSAVPTPKSGHLGAGSEPFIGGPTEKQIARMMAIAKKSGWGDSDIKDYLAKMGIKSRRELNRLQYDSLCNNMEKYPRHQETGFDAPSEEENSGVSQR